MSENESVNKLWEEISRLNHEVDALERKLATLAPEDLVQIQVQLAVLQNSLITLKDHIDRRYSETEVDIVKLDKDKVSKADARIPHLIIYIMSGSILLGVLYTIFEKIGLQH